MKAIRFIMYQSGTTKSGKDVNIAVERETNVENTGKLNQVLGGIFAAAFRYLDAIKHNNVKVFAFSLPVHLRFEYDGQTIDTASFERNLADKLKVSMGFDEETGQYPGFKRYAKRVWSFTMLETIQTQPSVFIAETGEVVTTAKLLAAAKRKETKAAKKTKAIKEPVKTEEQQLERVKEIIEA